MTSADWFLFTMFLALGFVVNIFGRLILSLKVVVELQDEFLKQQAEALSVMSFEQAMKGAGVQGHMRLEEANYMIARYCALVVNRVNSSLEAGRTSTPDEEWARSTEWDCK